MARIKISLEIVVPNYITENMVSCKFDNIENEMYEHLDGELKDDDEIVVENFSYMTMSNEEPKDL